MEGKIGRMTGLRNFSKKIAIAEHDRYHGTPWEYDNAGVTEYDEKLGVLFGGSILNFTTIRKLREGRLIVMDFMGHGQVLRELGVTAGIAVALGDSREDSLKELDKKRGIDVVAGDILSKKTWTNISKQVGSQNGKGIDLVLCRPTGGYKMLPDDPNIYFYILSQLWNMLSENKGALAAELPSSESHAHAMEYLDEWGDLLAYHKIEFVRREEAVLLTKRPQSAKILPALTLG